MNKFLFLLAAILSFGTAWSQNVGVGTTSPGTKLDVNGAITLREGTCTVSATSGTIPNGYSQVRLTGSPSGAFTLTAPAAPANPGVMLHIYNNTTGGYAGTFSGITIPNGDATEFIYTNSTWVPTAPASSGSGNYIQNQNAAIQPTSTYRISGGAYVGGADTVGGNLNVIGNAVINGTLSAAGVANFSTGYLHVQGPTNLVGADTFASNTINFTGSTFTTAGGILAVSPTTGTLRMAATGTDYQAPMSAGTGIGISSNTISNTGVTSFNGGTTGLTPSSSSTGAVTLAGTLGVANGGSGIATTTAYGVLTGGTTATGAFQNAGAGTSGQVLMSGGAAALPTWTTLSPLAIAGSTSLSTVTTNFSITTISTLTNITGLSATLAASATYEIEAVLGDSVNTNGKYVTFAVAYTGTGSNTLAAVETGQEDNATKALSVFLNAFGTTTIAGGTGYGNQSGYRGGVVIKGIVTTVAGGGGTLTIQMENLTGASMTGYVLQGSYLKVTRIQ